MDKDFIILDESKSYYYFTVNDKHYGIEPGTYVYNGVFLPSKVQLMIELSETAFRIYDNETVMFKEHGKQIKDDILSEETLKKLMWLKLKAQPIY